MLRRAYAVRGGVGYDTRVEPGTHHATLAAAYARAKLGRPELDDEAALAAARAAGLRLHRFKRAAQLPRVRAVLGALRSLGIARLLDLGSGRGVFLWPLLDELPWVSVTAADVLPRRVEDLQAVRRGGVARLTAVRMDAARLAVADGAFDAVTILEVLEHLPRPELAAGEALRAARRAVVASVPSHADDNPEHIQLFDRVRLERTFLDAGARRVTVDYVRGHAIAVALR